MIRTQYNRAAFQVPFDATVRISLDTNLAMIKENTDAQPAGLLHRSALRRPPLQSAHRLPFTVCPYALLSVPLGAAIYTSLNANLVVPDERSIHGQQWASCTGLPFGLPSAVCPFWCALLLSPSA